MAIYALAGLLVFAVGPRTALGLYPLQFTAVGATTTEGFGHSIAVDGDYMAVGAMGMRSVINAALLSNVANADYDGLTAAQNNYPFGYNRDQADSDGDGIDDALDNCPFVYNPDQTDTDQDGVGDVCDICPGYDDHVDTDMDGVPDGCDRCPGAMDFDSDGDTVPDCVDVCPGFDDRLDSDGDGIPDGCDSVTGDYDQDGDVDLADVAALQACFSGPSTDPGYVLPTTACLHAFDFERDHDIDWPDLGDFATRMSGPRGIDQTVTAVIGPSGGNVTLPNGAALEIPAGALPQNVSITLACVQPPGGTGGTPACEIAGDGYMLAPAGLAFSSPALLSIPYKAAMVPSPVDGLQVGISLTDENGMLVPVGSENEDQEGDSTEVDLVRKVANVFISQIPSGGKSATRTFIPHKADELAAYTYSSLVDAPSGKTISVLRHATAGLRQGDPERPVPISHVIIHSVNANVKSDRQCGTWQPLDMRRFLAKQATAIRNGKFSVHYVIGRGGEIIQIADDSRRLLHATSAYYNDRAIGIELINDLSNPDDVYSGPQATALVRLLDFLVARHHLPLRAPNGSTPILPRLSTDPILTHAEVASSKSDPSVLKAAPPSGIDCGSPGLPCCGQSPCCDCTGPCVESAPPASFSMDAVWSALMQFPGVIRTKGGDGWGQGLPGAGGEITIQYSLGNIAPNGNTDLFVPPDTLTSGAYRNIQISGDATLSADLHLIASGEVFIAETGKILAGGQSVGANGHQVTIEANGPVLVFGVIDTAGADAHAETGNMNGGNGGGVVIRSGSPGPGLIPTIITRGGDADNGSAPTAPITGGAGGAIAIKNLNAANGSCSMVVLGGSQRSHSLHGAYFTDGITYSTLFWLGNGSHVYTPFVNRADLHPDEPQQVGFTRGLLTSGGTGGAGSIDNQPGSPGGNGGAISVVAGPGVIDFRDIDIVTGTDIEAIEARIHRYMFGVATNWYLALPTGCLGGPGYPGYGGSGAGGPGGAAGRVSMQGRLLAPIGPDNPAITVSTLPFLVYGFNLDYPTNYAEYGSSQGNVIQASGPGGRLLYRLRVDSARALLGGSGSAPGYCGRRPSCATGQFGARGASAEVTGLPTQ